MTQSIEDQILTFIRGLKPAHAGVGADTDLIGGAILDSLAVLQLVTYLKKQFGVALPARDVTPQNLKTVQTIARLVAARAA